MSETPISPLRARMIEDMSVRKFGEKTQNDYIRHVKSFSSFLGRSPAKATAEDLRRYQVHQSKAGEQPPTINSAVSALRFFFRVTLTIGPRCAGTSRWYGNRRSFQPSSARRKSYNSCRRPLASNTRRP